MTTTIDDLIEQAVNQEDLEALEQIQDAVRQTSTVEQSQGAMAERRILTDPAGLLARLGVESGAPAQESFGLDLANRVAHAIRLVEYRRDRRQRPDLETLVAEGDSWFLHQLLTDTLDHLRKDFNVRSLAAAGDTVESMVRSKDDLIDVLNEERPRVFLFSGGGNDLLGDGKVAQVVLDESRDRSPADLIQEATFGRLLKQLVQRYEELLGACLRHAPGVQVFSHGYDHVVKIASGPWIWPFLEAKGYTQARAREVVKVLLDRFNDELARLGQVHSNFVYIDMRGQVGGSASAWYDAIHPKDAGFGRVAGRFAEAVRAYLGRRREGVELGVVPPVHRGAMPPAEAVWVTAEAVTSAFASRPRLTDFETLREAASRVERDFPDESRWLPYDAATKGHIRDVLQLLRESEEGRSPDPQILANRLATRPASAGMRGAGEAWMPSPLFAGPEAVNEALVGASEIEPVQILLQGYRAARCVGRVQVMSPHQVHIMHGSGFLVGPGLLLTNCHVLADADTAARSYVIFDDEVALDGALPQLKRFKLTGDIYWASAELDYAFASVEAVNRDGAALAGYDFLPLIERSGKAVTYEPVSIVQHPGGDPKAIAMRNSFVMGRVGDGIYYTTDTKSGSSGSPVLNREWQVVALHHRFVPHPTDPNGVLANRGVRISCIYDDLRRAQAQGSRMAARILHCLASTGLTTLAAPVGAIGAAEGAGALRSVDAPALGSAKDALAERPAEIEAERAWSYTPDRAWVADGAYSGLAEAEFLGAIAREDGDGGSDIPLPASLAEAGESDAAEALPLAPEDVLARIGARGYRLIVAHEVSSRAHYEAKLRNPILPGGRSGVTIGIGYDLGYQTLAGFRSHWNGLLPAATIARLEVCIGKTQGAASAALRRVQDVVVPFDAAIEVFERDSLPRYFGMLNRHIRDAVLDALHPHCVAALVSLTFNRGPSYQADGPRYSEMRAIRAALNGGEPHKVPGLIRAMKRLWQGQPGVRGLLRRRDEEAELFQAGLDAMASRGPAESAALSDLE